MKILISTFAMAIALAFTGPAFAGDVSKAKTEADCQKHGGMWDAKTNALKRRCKDLLSGSLEGASASVGALCCDTVRPWTFTSNSTAVKSSSPGQGLT